MFFNQVLGVDASLVVPVPTILQLSNVNALLESGEKR